MKRMILVIAMAMILLCTPSYAQQGKIAFEKYLFDPKAGKIIESDIYLINADGSGLTKVTKGIHASGPSWSPDGKQLFFTNWTSQGIAVLDLSTQKTRQVVFNGYNGAWSPDGKQIAYIDMSLPQAIYISDIDGKNGKNRIQVEKPRQGFIGGRPFTAYYSRPAWSPDGKQIAYSVGLGKRDQLYIASIDVIPPKVELILKLPGQIEDLNPGKWPPAINSVAWSPDGREIALFLTSLRDDWPTNLYVLDLMSRKERKLLRDGEHGQYPSWSPDGEWIVFSDPFYLWLIKSDGSERKLLHESNVGLNTGSDWWKGKEEFSVEPSGKLWTIWGRIKAKY